MPAAITRTVNSMFAISRSIISGTLAALLLVTFGCKGSDRSTGPSQLTPASIAAQTSTTITGVAGNPVSPVPAVRVTTANNEPVPNVSVSFIVSSGSGTVGSTSAVTGADGVASVGRWTLGTNAGQQQLTATISGLPAVQFTATASADPPASILPTGNLTFDGIVGTALANLPAAIVKDQYDNPVPGAAVSFVVTAGGGSVTGGNATTDVTGIARPTSWTLGSVAGVNILTAAVSGVSAPATFTASPSAPATALTFVTGAGQTAPVNTEVPVSPTLRVTDAFGNRVAGVTVNFSVSAGSIGIQSATTAPDGVLNAGAWILGKTVGTNTLTATSGTLSATLTAVGVGGPASVLVAVAMPPATATVGTNVTPSPSVRVTDAYANVVTDATVVFTVLSGGGSLSGATVVSDANGIATLGSWTLGSLTGTQTVRASAGTATLDFSVNALAGPP